METVSIPQDPFEDAASLVGERVGRYTILREVAAGGMGTVYLARAATASGFETRVAVKCMRAKLVADEDLGELFLDEARIASRIDHPNVCTVFDFGIQDGVSYLVMEYLAGEPFAKIVARIHAPSAPGRGRRFALVARVIADACEGLHAAHELRDADGAPLRIVHRDVSPQNIFVTHEGAVKVVDFGIARAADQIHRTKTGTVRGKWAYMSPEQLRAEEVDRRTDIWALGVILWESLTGERLFKRSVGAETALAIVNDPIPHPREVRPEVPEALAEIALRALSRDPADRFTTAREMGRALLRATADTADFVGSGDLAEWLSALFPPGGAHEQGPQEQGVDRRPTTPQVTDVGEGTTAVTPERTAETTPQRRRSIAPDAAAEPRAPAAHPTPQPTGRYATLLAAVALIGVVATLALWALAAR